MGLGIGHNKGRREGWIVNFDCLRFYPRFSGGTPVIPGMAIDQGVQMPRCTPL